MSIGSKRKPPKWLNKLDLQKNTEQNRLINAYFSEEFLKVVNPGQEYEHKITFAIAEKLIDDPIKREDGTRTEFAGIIYPGIATSGDADNLAIKPAFADTVFRLEEVMYARINARSADFEYNITRVDFANTFEEDGTIKWKGRASV